jgi:excisionase family DNA binding protein
MKKHGHANGSPKFDDLPDWSRPMEVARYLHISRSAVYELLRTKAIPSRRLGRSIRIPKAALDPNVQELAGV